MRYGQVVVGPAGSGKSTYCSNIVKHCETIKRVVRVVNLDPAAEHFDYPVDVDIRELIQVDDVMEDKDLKFGPNGGLVFCMEYLMQNMEWLQEQLGDNDDDYFLFDCPGQIELYTHMPVMRNIVDILQHWNFRLCAVYLMDSHFLTEATKFFGVCLTALSTMVQLELPHISVLSKMDLLSKKEKKEIDKYLDPDVSMLVSELNTQSMTSQHHSLTKAIARLIEEYSLVSFIPLDVSDEESIGSVLLTIDMTIQYGEDYDVLIPKDNNDIDDDDNNTTT